MLITYDPNKRAKTLAERSLDFKAAADVFRGPTVETLGEARHAFSMRKANEREERRFAPLLGI